MDAIEWDSFVLSKGALVHRFVAVGESPNGVPLNWDALKFSETLGKLIDDLQSVIVDRQHFACRNSRWQFLA